MSIIKVNAYEQPGAHDSQEVFWNFESKFEHANLVVRENKTTNINMCSKYRRILHLDHRAFKLGVQPTPVNVKEGITQYS